MRMFGNETPVNHTFRAGRPRRSVQIDQRLADSGDGGYVATDLDLVILSTDRRLTAGGHFHDGKWIREGHQPTLAQGIEGHDCGTAFARVLKLMEHARTVGTYVLPEEEKAIGVVKVGQLRRADRNPYGLGESHRRALVAHVRAVGKIVVS